MTRMSPFQWKLLREGCGLTCWVDPREGCGAELLAGGTVRSVGAAGRDSTGELLGGATDAPVLGSIQQLPTLIGFTASSCSEDRTASAGPTADSHSRRSSGVALHA